MTELAGVSGTALGVAYARASESERDDRLFHDPFAQAFLAAAPAWVESTVVPPAGETSQLSRIGTVLGWHVAVRTRFFDDYLLAACRAGCRQVVLLAAGLDARAWRLDWPSAVELFEVDLAPVLAFKERVLAEQQAQPRCRHTPVAADLRADWPARLTAAGFEPARPTAWLAEGLLIYLSPDEVTGLLAEVDRLSAAGSQLSFEHGSVASAAFLDQVLAMPVMREYTSLWRGGFGWDAPQWLSGHGWQVRRHEARALGEAYRRPPPADGDGTFVTAVRNSNRRCP